MIPADVLVHTAAVTPLQPTTATFGDAFDLPCYVERHAVSAVHDSNGADQSPDATLYADPGDDVPVGSRLTVNGFGAEVISVLDHDDGGLTGLAHREIALRTWPL